VARWRPGWIERWCLARIRAAFDGAPFEVRLWDGTRLSLSSEAPVAVVTVHDRAALAGLVLRPELAFGEGYAAGRIEVQGDLVGLMEAVNRAWMITHPPVVRHRLDRGRQTASTDRSRRNVHRHYDLGNSFYKLWLDEAMVYTCAYYEHPDMTLEAAQHAKLDYVCRKLRLSPGDRVVEAGCGWGALALHMARNYGVNVRAYNVSSEQLAYAREQAARAGLTDRVTFIDADYREISEPCDVFVSVGMLEHVGSHHYQKLGDVIARVLHPAHGRGLLHFIGRNHPRRFSAWAERYIFPGAYAPVLAEVFTDVFEPHNLSVLDVENLRLHYVRTVADWHARFEQRVQDVRAMFDEHFVRMWRLYLASSEAAFSTGDLQLFQVVFGQATDNSVPRTRHYQAARDVGRLM